MEELDKSKSGNPMEGEARGKMSIEEFLAKDEQKDLLRFLTAGSVDDVSWSDYLLLRNRLRHQRQPPRR